MVSLGCGRGGRLQPSPRRTTNRDTGWPRDWPVRNSESECGTRGKVGHTGQRTGARAGTRTDGKAPPSASGRRGQQGALRCRSAVACWQKRLRP